MTNNMDMSIELSRLYRAAFAALKRGDIVSRKSDPVHVGQITSINIRSDGRFASIRWFPHMIAEHNVRCDELEIAEEWK